MFCAHLYCAFYWIFIEFQVNSVIVGKVKKLRHKKHTQPTRIKIESRGKWRWRYIKGSKPFIPLVGDIACAFDAFMNCTWAIDRTSTERNALSIQTDNQWPIDVALIACIASMNTRSVAWKNLILKNRIRI